MTTGHTVVLAIGAPVREDARDHGLVAGSRDRFGMDAVRLANSPEGRRLHLRGIYVRVVVPGTLGVGDAIEKLPVPVTA